MTDTRPPLALVTGGCRRIGAAIAARLAQAGWALGLHGHSDAEPEPALRAVLETNGTDWHGVVAELESPQLCAELVDVVTERFGRGPDLLVNNASLFEDDEATGFTARTLDRHLAVNLAAPLHLSRECMARRGEGALAIVHIIDQRVRNPHGDQFTYTIAKQALAEAIRTQAVALAPHARVNGVAPGLTLPTDDYDEAQWARLTGLMPLERLAAPAEIAEAVHFLATAPSVTGQLLFVDAGASLKSFDRDFVHLGR